MGDLARLKLEEIGVNRSFLAPKFEVVMVQTVHHATTNAPRRYSVVSTHGIIAGKYTMGDGLMSFDGRSDSFPYDTLESVVAHVGEKTLSLSQLAALSNVRHDGDGCSCRSKGGKKCAADTCPCALKGRACSRACHKNGCCLNWTKSDGT